MSEREGEKSKAAQPFVAPFARAAQPLRCVRGRRVRERWAEERERDMKAVQPGCELRACGYCLYQHGGTAVGCCSAFSRFPVRPVPCVIRDSGAVCMCLSFLLTPQPHRPHRRSQGSAPWCGGGSTSALPRVAPKRLGPGPPVTCRSLRIFSQSCVIRVPTSMRITLQLSRFRREARSTW